MAVRFIEIQLCLKKKKKRNTAVLHSVTKGKSYQLDLEMMNLTSEQFIPWMYKEMILTRNKKNMSSAYCFQ